MTLPRSFSSFALVGGACIASIPDSLSLLLTKLLGTFPACSAGIYQNAFNVGPVTTVAPLEFAAAGVRPPGATMRWLS